MMIMVFYLFLILYSAIKIVNNNTISMLKPFKSACNLIMKPDTSASILMLSYILVVLEP